MALSRDSNHKRFLTGGKKSQRRKKRKFNLVRQPSNTKIGIKRIHVVRTRGGNKKFRGLRLDHGSFSWASQGISRKTKIASVVYHPSNNELVRTNTLTKSAIIQIDATPYKHWFESHYGVTLGKKKSSIAKEEQGTETAKKVVNKKQVHCEPLLEHQFNSGRLYAVISSRPGQSGRCDGYILEGDELAFYLKKLISKK